VSPTLPGFAGSKFAAAKDKDLAIACVTAWNDWMIDEWCADQARKIAETNARRLYNFRR
jgi:hypothetical protein